jgi:hypothetical protein
MRLAMPALEDEIRAKTEAFAARLAALLRQAVLRRGRRRTPRHHGGGTSPGLGEASHDEPGVTGDPLPEGCAEARPW